MGILSRYKDFLSLSDRAPLITLGEGSTPHVRLEWLEQKLDVPCKIYAKMESQNPTGSFKDRGMVVAVSDFVAQKKRKIMCASTGNTAASAAAYGALVGLPVFVVVPKGAIAAGKRAMIGAYGASIIEMEASFANILVLVNELCTRSKSVGFANSLNHMRIEGQMTGAFEINNEVGAVDMVVLPIGNAGNICAYHRGFERYIQKTNSGSRPRFIGVQAMGASPMLMGTNIAHPTTVASAIRIGNPARKQEALAVLAHSKGKCIAVSDEEILSAQAELARRGLWVEAASATPLAALSHVPKNELMYKTIVLVCTGAGVKDPDVTPPPRFPSIECLPTLKNLKEIVL